MGTKHTKDELAVIARQKGISVKSSWTKDEIAQAIDADVPNTISEGTMNAETYAKIRNRPRSFARQLSNSAGGKNYAAWSEWARHEKQVTGR